MLIELLLIVRISMLIDLLRVENLYFSLFCLNKNVPKNHLFNRITKIAFFFGSKKLFVIKKQNRCRVVMQVHTP